MWIQPFNPLHNLVWSTVIAVAPIIILGGLLLSRKVAGYVATIVALLIALIIAICVYSMPAKLAGLSGLYGILDGLMPISWIVLAAIFLYNISVASGSFDIVRRSIESITNDRRLQALLIAFCFGAFLEGAAGFGAPVAITAGILIGLGFVPIYAATVCLLANTAPVAFGGIGIAVVTASQLTNISANTLSRMIGHQLPLIALIIPLWLVIIIAGWRNARAIWPAILVTGGAYAITMFLTSSYLGPSLPDILSSIVSMLCLVGLLSVWKPKTVWRFPNEKTPVAEEDKFRPSTSALIRAWTPFLLLIVFITNWAFSGTKALLERYTVIIPFGPLNHSISVGGHLLSINYEFAWLQAAGTSIFLAAILSAILMRMPFKQVLRVAGQTINELKRPILTIASIVGFAYVANYSGMSATLSRALSNTGKVFPLVAPLLGWIGVFITGSDTSSNALFSTVQAHTATTLGINPVLTVASNSTGGVAAKMISPQNIAVAAAATKLTNKEGRLFRRVVLHSVALISIICIITYVQANYLKWMIPSYTAIGKQVTARFSSSDMIIIGISVVAIIALAITAHYGRSSAYQKESASNFHAV
jgi:lactate permease